MHVFILMFCMYKCTVYNLVYFHILINRFLTYDVEFQEVSETRGAIHPHQDSILQVRAEANG